ncbi:MAG: recombinase family protein [Lachnospiraceae bacterium]|jgi:site-specific DNA recombinase|nr:recombinase family protein [Lachnospiraceae bacterium]
MRIAIYGRKSKWTGKGESVENQLTMCREYIERFVDGGKEAEIVEYEDEGFSGKNVRRPRFQQMMRDMESQTFDYLVCYKLDRLGRNLADLALLMESLEHRGISFISIKERFDTTTPIGKAMLYFSGVLAQMEREQIAERVRDNMLMLARSGRWLGGNTPLGFVSKKLEKEDSEGKRRISCYLAEKPEELELVKFMFAYFLKEQSLTKVTEYLWQHQIRTRKGKEFSIMGVRDILTNPVYCMADREAYEYFYDLGCQICIEEDELDNETGLMSYAKTSSGVYKNQTAEYGAWIISRGKHRGAISGKDYVSVQQILSRNKKKGESFRSPRNHTALLSGLLRCACGHRMRPKNYPPSRLNEKGERTFAYLCPYKDKTHGEGCRVKNVHGNTLDAAVFHEVLELAKLDGGLLPVLEALRRKIKNADESISSEQRLLLNEYKKKRAQIDNLVDSLKEIGEDSVSVHYIKEEIQRLDETCKDLQKEIHHMEKRDEEAGGSCEWPEQAERVLRDPFELFKELTAEERREYLHGIVREVVWDGETAHIYVSAVLPAHYRSR